MMSVVWQFFTIELLWLFVIGLALIVPGAILVAITVLARVSVVGPMRGKDEVEFIRKASRRRRMAAWGGALLLLGFSLQGLAMLMQIYR